MSDAPPDPFDVVSPARLPHRASVPLATTELLYCAVRGFEIPSLPGLEPEMKDLRSELTTAILYRFQSYLTELHGGNPFRAVALQVMSHPEEATLGSRVRIYLLCRAAAKDEDEARREAHAFAEQVRESFPSENVFAYGSPRPLGSAELQKVLFHPRADDAPTVDLVELRKYEESQTWSQQATMHYVPHRLWSDQQRDPWLSLIETLASVPDTVVIRVELTPVRLEGEGLAFITVAGRWFQLIDEDLKRKAQQGQQVRTDGVVTEDMMRQQEVARASENAANIAYVRRGAHVYERLNTFAHNAFTMRVVLASSGSLPASITGSVRAALCMPPADDPAGGAGWHRPEVVPPGDGDRTMATNNLRYLAQTRWGRTHERAPGAFDIDLRPVVTPEEAAALFHLPIYHRTGTTSAISTVESPFVIPPETLATTRDDDEDRVHALEELARKGQAVPADPEARKKPRVVAGHLYQRDRLLDRDRGTERRQPFYITIDDLMKPSLLVGAPGSGKTNLALGVLIELWERHRIPFLVLDPSTGQEFRLLLQHPAFQRDEKLVVYTVGDRDGFPLEFNPFSVPPRVNVRSHTTRLLAAFQAAIEMQDPIPSIFEAALERVYSTHMTMDQKGVPGGWAPTFDDFNRAMRDELKEKVLPLYAGSQQTIGNLRGASTLRVNSILKKLGYIINARGNNDFISEMLRRPTVIEMGALGDSSNITLVMAFFLSQLAGYIEYEHDEQPSRKNVILIEEAHRLLGVQEGKTNKAAEDLNMMLAEVRKFGQGIMVMDQRPSSLVGGVLDNAFVKLLMRLSDREGFDRLSHELNLSEAHQRYARTRLRAGDAIMLDRDSGQPVLIRGVNLKDSLEGGKPKATEQIARVRSNAEDPEHGLKTPRPTVIPFTELPMDTDAPSSPAPTSAAKPAPAAAAPIPQTLPPSSPAGRPAAAAPPVPDALRLFGESVDALARRELTRDTWNAVQAHLTARPGDRDGALQMLEEHLGAAREKFGPLTDTYWRAVLKRIANSIALRAKETNRGRG